MEFYRPILVSKIPLNRLFAVNETATINKQENGMSLFPNNLCSIAVHNKEHNPPHIHIMMNGWGVCIEMESGEVCRIKRKGKKKSDISYIISNIKEWLDSTRIGHTNQTNREFSLEIRDTMN